MTTLSLTLRRADVAAFWIVSSAVAIASFTVLAILLRADRWWLWSIAPLVVLHGPALLSSGWYGLGVKAWNRLTRLVTHQLRWWTMRLCFYAVVLPMSSGGSRFQQSPPEPGESMWKDWTDSSFRLDLRRNGLFAEYLAALRSPEHRWMAALFPFMITLMLLSDQRDDSTPPTSTYTLY